MKLSLSTDFGAPHHWERVIDFAKRQGVERVVFWADFGRVRWGQPYLYPRYPGLLPADFAPVAVQTRERMANAARLARKAGIEFWYCYQVLMHPPREHVARATPDFFSRDGEPDMAGDSVYRYLRDQLDELHELAPDMAGLEVWVMECASTVISRLRRQTLPLGDICERIVGTVDDACQRRNMQMSLDLHTAGGNREMLDGLARAAQRRPHLLVGADNVVGDFHIGLPFNEHLARASATNRINVHFDLNGEYWGRNYIPTCALSQYAAHVEEARRLNAAYADGRLATGHDQWSPHANVLPSRRLFYPGFASWRGEGPIPTDLEICCADTLNGFNAEFFCRRVKNPAAAPRDIARQFVAREFGPEAGELADVLADVEPVSRAIFFADHNYFNIQSIFLPRAMASTCGLDVHLTTPAGEPFPPPEGLPPPDPRLGTSARAQFEGSPVPQGLRAAGPEAMVAEKQAALASARALIERADRATARLAPGDRAFVLRQFEDLVFYARAAAALMEAMAHAFHLLRGRQNGRFPDRDGLRQAMAEMRAIANEWKARQPADPWQLARTLESWYQWCTNNAEWSEP